MSTGKFGEEGLRVGSSFFWNGNVRIHAHLVGDGPPIILLHGFPEYWGVWSQQIEVLARDHLVIAPDMRGFNLSDQPSPIADYSASATASDILAIVARLNLPQVTIIGHDIGGMTAWWLASQYPDLVERLIILSSPYPGGYLQWRDQPQNAERSSYVDQLISNQALDWLQPQRLSGWVTDEGARHGLEEALGRSSLELIRGYYRANLCDSARHSWENLSPVSCPTLVIYGEHDPFLPVSSFHNTAQWVNASLTFEEIAGHGHYLHTSASQAVSDTIRHWLAANPRMRAH